MDSGSSSRRHGRAWLLGLCGGALLTGLNAAQANAAELVQAPASGLDACPVPSISPAALISPTDRASKAAALLGGAASALDAIRAQQASAAPESGANAFALRPAEHFELAPAVGAVREAQTCPLAAVQGSADAGDARLAQFRASDDYLASRRVRIGRTNFDGAWNRVRSERLGRTALRRYLGPVETERSALLSQVNLWANRHIAYTEDKDQYGKSDFWAGARRTLKSGRGDCEDIALAKMHLLLAAGVSADDLIITIARDLVRRADHAVLIVRTDNGYVMLDNSSDEVLDASLGNDYRPILSFGSNQTWLHGV